MRATILPALLTAFLSIATSVGAATYYVATTGNDGNAGTSTSPWRTLHKAAATLLPGDTALVSDGTYEEGQISFTRSGTSTQPITLKAANKWLAILSSTSRCNPAISLYASYITIQDLRISVSGSNVTCTARPASANGAIRAWNASTPNISTNPTSGYVGFTARGLLVDASAARDVGIKTNQDNSLIESCEVHSSIEMMDTKDTIIRNNAVYVGDAWGDYIMAKGGQRNGVISGNVLHLTSGTASGIKVGGTSCGACHWDPSTLVECYNCMALNNVILNEGAGNQVGALGLTTCQNCTVMNNVVVGGQLFMNGPNGPSLNPTFKNNIVVANGLATVATGSWNGWDGYYTGTLTVDYNDFYQYTSGVPSQVHPITGSPLFVNIASDWHLQAGSPAIGTGTPVTMGAYGGGTVDVSHDKDGTIRTVPWDLGIYASSGSAPPPPPPPPDTTPPGS